MVAFSMHVCMYVCVTCITDAACTLCNIILLLFVKIKLLKQSLENWNSMYSATDILFRLWYLAWVKLQFLSKLQHFSESCHFYFFIF